MKVLIVCHGNICRSPAAHYLLEQLLLKDGLKTIQIESAGLIQESRGKAIHPRIARALRWLGCDARRHRSVFIADKNLAEYRYILAMDQEVLYELQTEFATDYRENCYLFTSVSETDSSLNVEDPIYTKKYWQTVRRINHLCQEWLQFFQQYQS